MGNNSEIDALLNKHVKSKVERDLLENYVDLYAIIKTVENLEKAYIQDKIQPGEYEEQCKKYIAQFKTLHDAVRSTVPDMYAFFKEWSLNCPRAENRLIRSGLPATVEHGQLQSDDSGSRQAAKVIAECTEAFIGLMDALRLNNKAVDLVSPYVYGLVTSINKVQDQVRVSLSEREKIVDWHSRLNQMKASDDLSDNDVRQLLHDTGKAYEEFRVKI